MLVLHDLIHSSRVHQDFVGGIQVSFLLHAFIQLFQFFPEVLCHVFIKYHSFLSSSCSIPPCLGGVLPNSFSLIRFLSRSNRSGFLFYLIP